jgi:hypothetical protein
VQVSEIFSSGTRVTGRGDYGDHDRDQREHEHHEHRRHRGYWENEWCGERYGWQSRWRDDG